jgi:DNA-binding CsgD family transcriptional regulator
MLYGLCLALLLFLLRWFELRFMIIHHAMEVYIGAVALIFTALGVWLAVKLARPGVETVVVREVHVRNPAPVNLKEIERLGISKRELEVLQLMADGMSNQAIASGLFVSVNTVKTHSSHLFEKLEVSSRTQAVEKARRLAIID